jgi:hypothetical protein
MAMELEKKKAVQTHSVVSNAITSREMTEKAKKTTLPRFVENTPAGDKKQP